MILKRVEITKETATGWHQAGELYRFNLSKQAPHVAIKRIKEPKLLLLLPFCLCVYIRLRLTSLSVCV